MRGITSPGPADREPDFLIGSAAGHAVRVPMSMVKGSGGGQTSPISDPNSAYNSWTHYEEFDRGSTGSLSAGAMANLAQTEFTNTFFTASAQMLDADPDTVLGAIYVATVVNATTAGIARYALNKDTSPRLYSMLKNGFKAEIRFWLTDPGAEVKGATVSFGWYPGNNSSAAQLDADGITTGFAGALVRDKQMFLVRRGQDGVIALKDKLCDLEYGVPYTCLVDTTSGELEFSVYTGTSANRAIVATMKRPKWTGWPAANGNPMYSFRTNVPNADRLGFGVTVGLTSVAPAVASNVRIAGIDAFYVNCPKVR